MAKTQRYMIHQLHRLPHERILTTGDIDNHFKTLKIQVCPASFKNELARSKRQKTVQGTT